MTIVKRDVYRTGTCFTPDKRRYFSQEEADKHAEQITLRKGRQTVSYACGKHWHLTTVKGARV